MSCSCSHVTRTIKWKILPPFSDFRQKNPFFITEQGCRSWPNDSRCPHQVTNSEWNFLQVLPWIPAAIQILKPHILIGLRQSRIIAPSTTLKRWTQQFIVRNHPGDQRIQCWTSTCSQRKAHTKGAGTYYFLTFKTGSVFSIKEREHTDLQKTTMYQQKIYNGLLVLKKPLLFWGGWGGGEGKFPKNNCSKSFLTIMNFHKVKVISCIFWHSVDQKRYHRLHE